MKSEWQRPWLGLAGLVCLVVPVVILPFMVWLLLASANPWIVITLPLLFGLGFLVAGQPRAYGLTAGGTAVLMASWWFGLNWLAAQLCSGRPPGEYCGLGWGLIGLAGLGLALLLIATATAIVVDRAAQSGRVWG